MLFTIFIFGAIIIVALFLYEYEKISKAVFIFMMVCLGISMTIILTKQLSRIVDEATKPVYFQIDVSNSQQE